MVSLPFLKKKKEEDDFNIPDQFPSDLNTLTPPQNLPQTTQIPQQPPQQTSNMNFSVPQPSQYTEPQYQYSQSYPSWEEYIQSIVEAVIAERLKEIENKLENLNNWREKIEGEISTIKDFLDALNKRIDEISTKTIEKIKDYDSTMKETAAEIKALHRVMQTMIPTIAESVRELKGVIEELKKLRENP